MERADLKICSSLGFADIAGFGDVELGFDYKAFDPLLGKKLNIINMTKLLAMEYKLPVIDKRYMNNGMERKRLRYLLHLNKLVRMLKLY